MGTGELSIEERILMTRPFKYEFRVPRLRIAVYRKKAEEKLGTAGPAFTTLLGKVPVAREEIKESLHLSKKKKRKASVATSTSRAADSPDRTTQNRKGR
jgi:hypothetical protein